MDIVRPVMVDKPAANRLSSGVARRPLCLLLALFVWGVATSSALAQTFTIDFARPADPPLVKTKFGVYQTPLVTLPRLLHSVPLLSEIGVSDLRYEIGWGKPDVLHFDQIGGTATAPTYNFATLDAFTGALKTAGVTPLLALTYCPNPLKSRAGWPAWKDTPANLATWEQICRAYVAHLKPSGAQPQYEVWNEPDMPEPNSKMFFTGGPDEYQALYRHSARAVRAGDPDALVGGAATAYDLRYLKAILPDTIDFVSIHAYDNYAAQIKAARGLLADHPDLPLYLTEYASFTDFPANGPQSRAEGAMRFFRDVKGLLNFPDVTKVYWAQWLDAGNGSGMGLITFDGHRKALFNAFQIYNLLPVDQVTVTPDGADGVNLLASCDSQHAGIVLWNETTSDRNVTVNLTHPPSPRWHRLVYRIDKTHASYGDNPATERLQTAPEATWASANAWTGTIPAQGIVFLYLVQANAAPPPTRLPGNVIRTLHDFPDRTSDAYADFDGKTGIARLGTRTRDFAIAQVGALLDHPASRIRLTVTTGGQPHKEDVNTLLGVRFDFPEKSGTYTRSTLYHHGLYDARRVSKLPWGKGAAVPDRAYFVPVWDEDNPLTIDLAHVAPPTWNRKRILVTFLMQNTGANTRAKFLLAAAPGLPLKK